jgi:translocation protein SEC63
MACPVPLLLPLLPASPPAGKYDLQLLCMPDSWVGCDRSVPIKLKVGGWLGRWLMGVWVLVGG